MGGEVSIMLLVSDIIVKIEKYTLHPDVSGTISKEKLLSFGDYRV